MQKCLPIRQYQQYSINQQFMKNILKRAIALVTMIFALTAVATAKTYKIYHFKVDEDIAKPAVMRVEKALIEAKELQSDIVVMQINTFGGELESADKIRTMLLQSPTPVWVYINNNAASAGALISIACEHIYMHSGSSIGAATVVNQSGEVQPDKYQSYMRSLMRTTAEARNRRPDIAEAMVDPDIEVIGISAKGKVLSFTTEEAIKNGYCDAQAESLKEILEKAGIEEYEIHEHRYSIIEKVVGFLINPVVSGILIMLIVGGLYFEFQSPGIGMPLVVAAVAAVLYFAPLFLEGLAANWEIVIFVIGIILLVLEIFVIPGFGFAGISGIVCVVAGLVLSLVGNIGFDFSGIPAGDFINKLFVVVISVTAALPLSIWLSRKLFEGRTFGPKLALNEVQNSSEGYTVSEPQTASMVGCVGIANTLLRPSGKVLIDGDIYDAVASASFVEKGGKVRVTGYENGTLVVEKTDCE